jgi:zinc transport system substrate-binding protein
MIGKRPTLEGTFSGHLASLRHDLATLDGELKAMTASKPALPLMASHPVYQYLARRYSLNLRSVHWEPN